MQYAEASPPTPAATRNGDRAIAVWLLACCALVFAMVVVGGITRLTHSGLSIVEWQPIVGTLPPLDEGAWQETFRKYQQTPEYRLVNPDMGLAEFKKIFWWEYAHRLLGRLIGAALLLPFLWFALRGKITRALAWKLAGIFALGALQGAMGWYMVQSGLVDDPRVSQYRLTAHLGIAFLIYAAMLWIALDLLFPRASRTEAAPRGLRRFAFALAALIFVMALSGGLVAGTRAGLAYNTFPLMDGRVVPLGIFAIEPWYLNFFSNMATVQFDHRLIAWLLAFLVPWFWMRIRRNAVSGRAKLGADLLLAVLALQIALGIATLLLAVPVPLAAAHQAGALLVFGAAIFVVHSLR
ncbi:MAG TPA: COX15/CtaA family protein [Burkholderiales bacterium]|nr:COX15/CtaA family protein [Burkholderiales bacterium]